jgi:hypothetical protein
MFSQAQVSFIAVAKYFFRAHYFSSSFLGSNKTDLNSSKSSGTNKIESKIITIIDLQNKQIDYLFDMVRNISGDEKLHLFVT